jgi:membrane fusion protein (multidrug efflux system)
MSEVPEEIPNQSDGISTKQTPQEKIQEAHTKKSRSHALLWFTLFLIILGLIWLALWMLYFQFHESTDDAYSNGNLININSAIPGSVIGFFCDDTDLVVEGQLIVQLDETEYKILFDKELSTLASVVLQVRQLYNAVGASQANVDSKKAALDKARFDFENRLRLHEIHPLSVSDEDYMHSKDDYAFAEAELRLAEKQLQTAMDAAGNTPIIHHPLIKQQQSNVRDAYYKLWHCSIYAPATGYVAQRAVEVGQWASPTKDLLAIIPTDYVWVDANYKETQLTYMRIGQPATVWFDLYGSKVMFEGRVLGIASGTGSIFSLIPPQNATGNWIKIVQRLPVRIGLDPQKIKEYPIRIGISAEVDVDISNQNLPRMAQIPSLKPVSTTQVFDIDLQKVEKMIDEIIHNNLKHEQSEKADGQGVL